jgi:hypothetical protein
MDLTEVLGEPSRLAFVALCVHVDVPARPTSHTLRCSHTCALIRLQPLIVVVNGLTWTSAAAPG